MTMPSRSAWRVKGQGQSPTERYWHEVLGFNYRMTNICAAIGLAQVERADAILARKRALAQRYRQLLATLPVAPQAPRTDAVSSEWLVSCLLPPNVKRDAVIAAMLRDGIETRPVFHCAHHMPMYRSGLRLPVSEDISARGISLPSYPGLTDREMDAVLGSLGAAIAAHT
jgi:perosamine synthetase